VWNFGSFVNQFALADGSEILESATSQKADEMASRSQPVGDPQITLNITAIITSLNIDRPRDL
jgi:hypothetical protein